MKLQANQFLRIVLGSMLISAPSFAGTFLMHLEKYPATTQSCPQEALAVGQRLSAASGVEVDRTYCAQSSSGYYDINVVYVAPKELKFLDSLNHNAIDADLGQGLYGTAAECRNDLTKQRDEFASMTGSVVLAASCAMEWSRSSYPFYPYLVSVVADEAVHPTLIYSTYELFSDIPRQSAAIGKDVEVKLRASGMKLRGAHFVQTEIDSRLELSYYALKAVPFQMIKATTFESEAACDTRSTAISVAYTQLGSPYLASFCSTRPHDPTTTFFFFRSPQAIEPKWFTVPGNYASRMDCEADKTKVVDRYRADGMTVAGSFCQYKSGFSIVLLY